MNIFPKSTFILKQKINEKYVLPQARLVEMREIGDKIPHYIGCEKIDYFILIIKEY